jgi:SAM-dependent methyltransferase
MSKDFWEVNAKTWAKVIDSNAIGSRAVTSRALVDAVMSLKPSTVLDVGCGEGWLASELVPRGIQYFGLDGSAKLIALARARSSARFEHARYEELADGTVRTEGSFDGIIFNFSLLDENLAPLLRAMGSRLTAQGSILIQTLHPCFALKPYLDGWKNEDFGALSVPFEGTMPWYGRTLSSWIRIFKESDLQLEETLEPCGPDGPLSILFRLKKLPRSRSDSHSS